MFFRNLLGCQAPCSARARIVGFAVRKPMEGILCGVMVSFLCFGGVVFQSCTILERRDDCPCQLVLDLSSESCAEYEMLTVTVNAGEFRYASDVSREDYEDGITVMVPYHGGASVAVVPKAFSTFWDGDVLHAAPGQQFPLLYSFHVHADTSGDYTLLHVDMHKNYCGISLTFIGDSSYNIGVTSSFGAIDLEGRPVEWAFHNDLTPEWSKAASAGCPCAKAAFADGRVVLGEGAWTAFVSIPRQGDESLQLNVRDGSSAVRSFALGRIMASVGYDWSSLDLQDMSLTIDYAQHTVTIRSSAWEDEIFVPISV